MNARPHKDRPVFEAWEKFMSLGPMDETSCVIRPEILESWRRSRADGVDAFQQSEPFVLSQEELRRRREEKADLLTVATPFMERLYQFVTGSHFVVALVDEEGFLLKIIGDPSGFCNLREGICLAEQFMGTNGYGTVLSIGKPFQVWGAEHYCRMIHHVTCSCAPVYDTEGYITGVLGVTGRKEYVHHHTLGMVVAATDAITNELLLREVASQKEAILESLSEGIVVLDREGKIIYVNAAAEKILGETSQNLVHKRLEQLLERNAKEGFNARLYKVLARGKKLTEELVDLVFPKKTVRCSLTVRSWETPAGRRNGAVLVIKERASVSQMVSKYARGVARFTFADVLGKDPRFLETVELAKRVARSDCAVLLTGESGTGKDVFAQAIHNASGRWKGPFVAINCAAIPRELLASELFGYEEGAFTGARRGGHMGKFELAQGGTLFLDEIGDMPLDMQAVLLRILEEKALVRLGGKSVIPVDVRIIAATNRDLEREVACGRFRMDLYYRLNVVKIHLPPLRERKGDIMLLVREFASHFLKIKEVTKSEVMVDKEAQQALLSYSWPGNIRELRNLVESVLASSDEPVITFASLPEHIRSAVRETKANRVSIKPLKDLELKAIQEALRLCNGNVALAARYLGIHRSTIYRRLGTEKLRSLVREGKQ